MLSPNELRDKADFLDGKNFGKSKSDEILAELCRQVAELVEKQDPAKGVGDADGGRVEDEGAEQGKVPAKA